MNNKISKLEDGTTERARRWIHRAPTILTAKIPLCGLMLALFALCPSQASAQADWALKFPATSPTARQGTAMACHRLWLTDEVVLFAGYDGLPEADTWGWDGTTWKQKAPPKSPPARYMHAMAYDAAHGVTVLFGGYNGNVLGDTWVWNGSTWTQKFPASTPSPRYGHAMVYDSVHGAIVLFGGYDGSKHVSDTWTWTGTTWNHKVSWTSPSARTYHAMAFDARHGEVVLFGGMDQNQSPLHDTWVFNGTSWALKSVSKGPLSRFFASMTYDSINQQTLLFGGSLGGKAYVADTWKWDGTTWSQLIPAHGPTSRIMTGSAAFPLRGTIVLFGGSDGGYLGDTWNWEIPPVVKTQPASQSLIIGQTATLKVVVGGTWPLSYQWYAGMSADTSNPIGGATGSSYTTPPLVASAAYWVRISNSRGAASSDTAVVTVAPSCVAASIPGQPESKTISAGQNAALSVTGAGTSPLSYQWYQGSSPDTSNPIAGATTSSYVTPPLMATTNYWVLVGNSCGQSFSDTAIVTVDGGGGAPFVSSVKSKTAKPGSRAIIKGGGFSKTAKNDVAYFGQLEAKVTKATSTSLKVKIPKQAAKGTTDVSVVVNGVASNSVQFVVK